MKFGDRLRQAREARGVTLDAIFQETHIAKRYLEALERSELGPLPGGIFDKGYIRSYARFVGIDPEPILAAYEMAKRRSSSPPVEGPDRVLHELATQMERHRGPRHWSRALPMPRALASALAMLVLAILVGGVWLLLPEGADAPEPERQAMSRAPGPSGPSEPTSPAELPSPVVELPPDEPSLSEETTRETPEPPPDVDGDPASRLVVSEAGLGTGVVDHALTGHANRFPEGTRVFFWNRVLNGEKEMVLRHIWKLGDETVMNSELVIGGPHWRTYSSYTLPPGSTGEWTVEAIGPDGRVLARQDFVCFDSPDLETGIWRGRWVDPAD